MYFHVQFCKLTFDCLTLPVKAHSGFSTTAPWAIWTLPAALSETCTESQKVECSCGIYGTLTVYMLFGRIYVIWLNICWIKLPFIWILPKWQKAVMLERWSQLVKTVVALKHSPLLNFSIVNLTNEPLHDWIYRWKYGARVGGISP